MMQGAFFFPCSNKSRTRDAPTPTNISTKSEPEIEKKGTFASPNSSRQERFARTGRANKQHTFRNTPTKFLKLLRLFQEINNLVQFFLGFIHAGHVFEGHLLLLAGKQTRPALPEGKGFVAATLHLTHKENPDAHQDNKWKQAVSHPGKPGTAGIVLDPYINVFSFKLFVEIGVILRNDGLELGVIFLDAGNLRTINGHLLDVALLDRVGKLGEGKLRGSLAGARFHHSPKQQSSCHHHDPKNDVFDR